MSQNQATGIEPKLYILVRNDLSRSQKAVQAVHAAAEYLVNNEARHGWDNGTVICSRVGDRQELLECGKSLSGLGVSFRFFVEPDIGDQETALAYIGYVNLFSDLPLL